DLAGPLVGGGLGGGAKGALGLEEGMHAQSSDLTVGLRAPLLSPAGIRARAEFAMKKAWRAADRGAVRLPLALSPWDRSSGRAGQGPVSACWRALPVGGSDGPAPGSFV